MPELYITTGETFARATPSDNSWTVAITLRGGVRCLAVDPRDGQTIYAGSRGRGVWKSGDGGRNWADMKLPAPDVFSLAVSAADGSVYAGCEPSRVFRSGDGARSWDELTALQEIPSKPAWRFPPRPWTSHVRWIAPCPNDAQRLLVGIELGGVMLSEDGGRSFSDHRPGAQKDCHSLAWHPHVPGRAYETAGGGAAWSRDGGRTWQAADDGRDRHYCWALAVDPGDPEVWYISASPGPRQAHSPGQAQGHIYRWRRGGPWQALAGGLSQPLEAMPYALLCTGRSLYAGLSDGRMYHSDDAGDHWRPLGLEGDRLSSITAMATCEP